MAEEITRKYLTINTVGTPREYSGNPVVQFSAIDEEGNSAGYETWGNELVPQIVKDAKLECEIIKTDKGILRITQIYVNGKPLKTTTRRTGGRQYGKSAEEIAIERASFEAQTAYNGIIELLKTGVLKTEDTNAKTALDWAEIKIRANMVALKPKPTKTEKATPAEDKKTPAAKVDEDTLHKLGSLVKDNELSISAIQALMIRHFKVSESKGLTQPQAEALIKLIEGNKDELKIKEPASKLI